MLWLRRLPKDHGKKHGRNRYEKTGTVLDKHAEIAAADERDRAIREKIERRLDLDLREKRAELARSLTPRVTEEAVGGHHSRIRSIVEAAREELGWRGGIVVIFNLMFGTVTPLFGLSLFLLSNMTGLSFSRLSMAMLPFYPALLMALALLTFVPDLSLWIPRMIR